MSMLRSASHALAALLIVPATAAAQAPAVADSSPRTTILAAAGGGPAIVSGALGRDYDAVVGTLGVRRRIWRALTAEGAVQLQRTWAGGADAVFVCQPVPDDPERCRLNQLGTRALLGRAFASAVARVGTETPFGAHGPSVRIAAGGGYMTRVREPFVSLSGGIAVGGRRARVALDLDHWRSRIDVIEVTMSARYLEPLGERRFRDGATSTFARLGIELPVGARR